MHTNIYLNLGERAYLREPCHERTHPESASALSVQILLLSTESSKERSFWHGAIITLEVN